MHAIVFFRDFFEASFVFPLSSLSFNNDTKHESDTQKSNMLDVSKFIFNPLGCSMICS